MTTYTEDRRQARKEQSYALRMLDYEMKVGFLNNTDIYLEPDKPSNQGTHLVLDECVINADHLNFETQMTVEDKIFFDGVRELCIEYFGQIDGIEKFEILAEACVSNIDSARNGTNFKIRKIVAKRAMLANLNDLAQFAKKTANEIKVDDVRTTVKFVTVMLAIVGSIIQWFSKK